MFQYLKDAFLARPHLPGLGAFPINVVAVACFIILGFGHPGFWLLGAGLEVAYLFFVATDSRFRKWVRAHEEARMSAEDEAKWKRLINQLTHRSRRRLSDLEAKCIKVMHLHRMSDAEDELIASNQYALKELMWVFLKLLIAQRNLYVSGHGGDEVEIRRSLAELEEELQRNDISRSLRESKAATVNILNKRLKNLERREQYNEEIESNLTRIEAQVDLALENASMKDRPDFISTDIEMAGILLDHMLYGDEESTVADLEDSFIKQNPVSVNLPQRVEEPNR